jgi:hypothetical protein
MKALGLITISLWCIAAPLAAQDTTHARRPGQRPPLGTIQRRERGEMDDMMPMMRQMMAPLMRVMAYAPEHLLSRKDSLKLTPDEITRLTASQNSAKSAHDAAVADIKTHLDEVSKAFQAASPDTTSLRMHFEAAHSAMGKAHWAMLSAAAQARAALTDAQRQKVDAWVNAMEQREGHEHTM